MSEKIIALIGMCGSGKSVGADYLTRKGYRGVYFGGITLAELKRRNMEVTPENEKHVREELRRTHGMAAFAILSLEEIRRLRTEHGRVYIDGLYSWEEYKVLREEFGSEIVLIEVYADKDIRYARLNNRPERPLTAEEAEKRDISEIENAAKGGPIAFSDFKCANNGNIEEFEKELERILGKITVIKP
ncbi:MAG: AAA family ATPase [Candidatus Lokiarchaeota archaeon]|nr:AAA family ATPase [Candidatus Lokiarchaeota archaeon]